MANNRLALTWFNQDKAVLPDGNGGYDWVERGDPRLVEVRLLREVDSVGDVTGSAADNLLIEGDSYDALQALTRIPEYSALYKGKVKLIYIDPPFNTGQAFPGHYDDNFEHSIWLSMFRARLRLLMRLLSKDGSIWVHLDDAEVHRAREVLDEELGMANFVGTVIWAKADTSRNDAKQFSTDHDYILVYSKKPGWQPKRLPRSAAQDAIYGSPDGDPHPWLSKPGHGPNANTHKGMVYAVQSPITGEMLYPPVTGCWRLGEDRMWEALNLWAPYKRVKLDDLARRAEICGVPEDEMPDVEAMVLDVDLAVAQTSASMVQSGVLPEVFFINQGALLQVKGYKPEGVVVRTIWPFRATGSNRNSKAESKKLFSTPFATPKPEKLLERVIQIATDEGDIVLDAFAGSGTTAAVAHKMGRRWVTIELSASTVARYVAPRLRKVVDGSDKGGITSTRVRVPSPGVVLPAGFTPETAKDFMSLLGKVLRGNTQPDEPDEDMDESADDEFAEEFEDGVAETIALTVDLPGELSKMLRAQRKDGSSGLTDGEVTSLLGMLRRVQAPKLDVTKTVKSQIGKALKTKNEVIVNWRGGGGFRRLKVEESQLVVAAGRVLLANPDSPALSSFVAAQLGYELRDDHPGVTGVKGRDVLVVIPGVVDVSQVEAALDLVGTEETLTLAGLSIQPEAAARLTELRPGSRALKVPSGLNKKSKVIR